MASETTFWYKRYERIPARDKTGKPTGGIVIVEAEDCINLYDVIRGFWRDGHIFTVQLKDGHEESVEKDLPDTVKAEMIRRKTEIPRERRFLCSYIDLHGDDIKRFRAATELILPKGVELPNVIAPHSLIPPKMEAQVDISNTSTKSIPVISPKAPAMTIVKDEVEKPQEVEKLVEKTHDIDLVPVEEVVTENNDTVIV